MGKICGTTNPETYLFSKAAKLSSPPPPPPSLKLKAIEFKGVPQNVLYLRVPRQFPLASMTKNLPGVYCPEPFSRKAKNAFQHNRFRSYM